jgi:RimJ/RimL family protein N-acetyltransferase
MNSRRGPEITTNRLLLRRWRESDLESFAALNSDRRVMEYFPEILTKDQSDELARRIERHFEVNSFGLWAVEVLESCLFIGFIGLDIPTVSMPFGSCVEVGWRLTFDSWGKGYATEGARAVLKFAFESLSLSEIVSFTVPANLRSRSVMGKIGMHYSPTEDFDHPKLPEEHQLRKHVLYRIRKDEWGEIVGNKR